VIIAAQGRGAGAKLVLNDLCGLYWQPVYALLRRKGNSPADSEDLTQGFFAALLSRVSLETVAEEKGRLRTFLCQSGWWTPEACGRVAPHLLHPEWVPKVARTVHINL
jgi:hypothetical protein